MQFKLSIKANVGLFLGYLFTTSLASFSFYFLQKFVDYWLCLECLHIFTSFALKQHQTQENLCGASVSVSSFSVCNLRLMLLMLRSGLFGVIPSDAGLIASSCLNVTLMLQWSEIKSNYIIFVILWHSAENQYFSLKYDICSMLL